jgi:hypothetical protein
VNNHAEGDADRNERHSITTATSIEQINDSLREAVTLATIDRAVQHSGTPVYNPVVVQIGHGAQQLRHHRLHLAQGEGAPARGSALTRVENRAATSDCEFHMSDNDFMYRLPCVLSTAARWQQSRGGCI